MAGPARSAPEEARVVRRPTGTKEWMNHSLCGHNGATRTNDSPVEKSTLDKTCLCRTNGGRHRPTDGLTGAGTGPASKPSRLELVRSKVGVWHGRQRG